MKYMFRAYSIRGSNSISFDRARENIRDLLNPSNTNLKIREMADGEVYVQDLVEEYCPCESDVLNLINIGQQYRTTSTTKVHNAHQNPSCFLYLLLECSA